MAVSLTAKRRHSTKVHSKTPAERKRRRIAALKRYDESPRGRYKQHKRNAKVRGVGFELSYEEWYELWEPYLDQRGNHAGGYVMARHGDEGPYRVGNVAIVTHETNVAERNRLYFASRRWDHIEHSDDYQHVHGAPFSGEPGPDVPF